MPPPLRALDQGRLVPPRPRDQPAADAASLGQPVLIRVARFAAPLAVLAIFACAAPAGAANVQQAKKNWRYPVSGAHNYGDLAVTGFGVLRPDGSRHTGQDILADCGTPLRAVHDSTVLSSGYSTGYGFYVVIDALGSGLDFAYGHLKKARLPRRGKSLHKGQRIGFVGMTGTDSGTCHLHFELWHGHWLKGKRTDPLPRLKLWDRFS